MEMNLLYELQAPESWGKPAVAFEEVVEANHDGGDPVIVVGRAYRVQRAAEEGEPLVFHRGRHVSLFGGQGGSLS